MSRAGAQAKRERNKPPKAEPPKRMSFYDLHELVCGCKKENVAYSENLCVFGDGWLDAA